jgi:hypothetical protein
MTMASPAGLHHQTPQNMGVSPVETHTPQQGDQPPQQTIIDNKIAELATAQAFVKAEMEKLRLQLTAQQQPIKNLTPEEKQQMKLLLSNQQVFESMGKIERLAPLFYLFSRDEAKTSNFLRLV